MSYIDIAPSILAADFGYLMRDIKKVEGHAEYLHIDVMDGHYVNNISFGIPVIQSIRKYTDMKFYTHLMITEPEKYIKAFADAGSDNITFHLECADDPDKLIKEINDLGCSAGISIHPDTPVEKVFPYIGKVKIILIMTVYPGFGGQGFIHETLKKVSMVRALTEKLDKKIHVEVDGGINDRTAAECRKAGADVLVSGTYLFGSNDMVKAVNSIKGI